MVDKMEVDESRVEDEYDEEADSDFAEASDDDSNSQSSGPEADASTTATKKSSKDRAKQAKISQTAELDSGDEATINEQSRHKQKSTNKPSQVEGGNADVFEGWKAKTRSMRAHEKEEKKQKKLVSLKTSTIDVEKLWEQMNRPGPLPPLRMEDGQPQIQQEGSTVNDVVMDQTKEITPRTGETEMITIRRQFKFAGEVHVEEKTVPKTSAEAQLWLSQQEAKSQTPIEDGGPIRQKPLRKISRFDPNYSNIEAFKGNWTRIQGLEPFKGPKLNVVEKSKMDWAVHVDSEGLQEELAEHAKAKGAYLNRMDFLNDVERRKEIEARQARLKS